eukprot:TRINITY_DN140_c0_g1_i5.p1 TRINITY_DN140_c0_g1~~TRINITY_DN140_c0_g1_i5.p1  ORF type:complete len:149 (-),score=33.04 TRINITY_DN140_c0_g1_i5:148-594(-)
MKTELCGFSLRKIYPGHGTAFVAKDSKAYPFENRKSKFMFLRKRNPREIKWTILYRRLHKKKQTETKKTTKRIAIVKKQRAYVGASLEAIKQKRAQKPEAREAARLAALREVKRKKAQKAKNKDTTKKLPAGAPRQKVVSKTPKHSGR